MASLVKNHQLATDPYYFHVADDFVGDQVDTTFIDTITDSGSVAVGDAAAGIATLTPSDGSVADNDEAYFASPNEVFKVASGKALYGAAYIQFTEAATNAANVAFGFQNAVGANSILDDGGGLKVSGDCFAIYKVDGSTVWKCVSCVNGTSTVSTSAITAGGSSYQRLEIEVVDREGRGWESTFKVDGQFLRDATTNDIIVHRGVYTSATEMQVFVGVKNGSANNQTLLVDWIVGSQVR